MYFLYRLLLRLIPFKYVKQRFYEKNCKYLHEKFPEILDWVVGDPIDLYTSYGSRSSYKDGSYNSITYYLKNILPESIVVSPYSGKSLELIFRGKETNYSFFTYLQFSDFDDKYKATVWKVKNRRIQKYREEEIIHKDFSYYNTLKEIKSLIQNSNNSEDNNLSQGLIDAIESSAVLKQINTDSIIEKYKALN